MPCMYQVWSKAGHCLTNCGEMGKSYTVPSGLGIKQAYGSRGDFVPVRGHIELCAEHAECLEEILIGVIDTDGNVYSQPEFTTRLKDYTPKAPKGGKPNVKHSVIPPSPAYIALVKYWDDSIAAEKSKSKRIELETGKAIALRSWNDGKVRDRAENRKGEAAQFKATKEAQDREQSKKDFAEAIARGEAEQARRKAADESNAKREAESRARAAAFPNVPAVQPGFMSSHVLVGTIPEPNAETVCGFRFEYRAEGGSGFYWNGKRVASTREGLERMGTAILAKVCK